MDDSGCLPFVYPLSDSFFFMSNSAVPPTVPTFPPSVQAFLQQLAPEGCLRVETQADETVLVLAIADVTRLYTLGQLMAHWAWICRQSEPELSPYDWLQFRFGDRTLLAVRPAWAPLDAPPPSWPGLVPPLNAVAST